MTKRIHFLAAVALGAMLAACEGGAGATRQPASGEAGAVPTADVAAYVATQTAQGASSHFGYGVRVSLVEDPRQGANEGAAAILNGVAAMRFDWLSIDASWKMLEPAPGEYRWEALDSTIEQIAAHPAAFRVLLVVHDAPDWARPAGADPSLEGPPSDPAVFGAFVGALADRYRGRVAAYEIWPHANLPAHWSTPAGPSAAEYVQLLRAGHAAVKSADPTAIVVSGGLAPVAPGDGVEDLAFLRAMLEALSVYAAGASQAFDALGVRVNGRDNPPQAMPLDGPSAHYFRHFESVRAMMESAGDLARPIWLTGVGWASANPAPPGMDYAGRNTEEQQAQYLVESLYYARQQPYVGAFIVDNFNLAVAGGTAHDAAFGLIRPDWSARPAFLALARLRQSDQLGAQATFDYQSARQQPVASP